MLLRKLRRRVPPGLYTYRTKEDGNIVLQLRVEDDGNGVLVVNANTVLYLNRTATAHVYFFMKGMSLEEAVKNIRKMFRVNKKRALEEHKKIVYTISTLARTEEVCPISYLEIERVEPFSMKLSAPVRVDLALTYRCQNNCIHCYAGGPRETEELGTEDWKRIIDKLVSLGVFLATFTGGEPTLREDLPELLRYAQEKGMVTGLITNGRRLKDMKYVRKLESCGLDFVQVTLESHIPEIHDKITRSEGSWIDTVEGIKNTVPTQIYLTTNTTINRYNIDGILDTVDFIYDLGVRVFGCNGLIYSGRGPMVAEEFGVEIDELRKVLPEIRDKARELRMKFVWYTPTRYCELNPVELDLGIKSCSAANITMCIGPRGEVYPCQSYFESVGNILRDRWKDIWNHETCRYIRNREYIPEMCEGCELRNICGGGCPLEAKERPYICVGMY